MVGPSKQASKQASKHTHACAHRSHASVGLAQARPNEASLQTLQQQIRQKVTDVNLHFGCYPWLLLLYYTISYIVTVYS